MLVLKIKWNLTDFLNKNIVFQENSKLCIRNITTQKQCIWKENIFLIYYIFKLMSFFSLLLISKWQKRNTDNILELAILSSIMWSFGSRLINVFCVLLKTWTLMLAVICTSFWVEEWETVDLQLMNWIL